MKDYRFDQQLISRVDQLVPARYGAGSDSKTPIRRALERATRFVHDTCPAGLKRDLLRRPNALFERCRVLGSLIPVHHFPPDGHVLDRFLKGLVEYLEEQNTTGGNPAPVNQPQSNGAAAATADGPQPATSSPVIIEAHTLAPVTAGSDERSAIKIESDTEPATSPARRKKSRKKRSSTKKPDKTTKKRKRDETATASGADGAADDAERTQLRPKKKLKRSSRLRVPSPVVDLGPQGLQADIEQVSTRLHSRLTVTERNRQTTDPENVDTESSHESDSSGDPDFFERDKQAGVSGEDRPREMRDSRRKKPLNVYKTMYEDGQDEIRFLQDLLIKGAGFTEADLKASKVRVKNGKSFKYAFELAFNKEKERDGASKDAPRKRPRVTL